MNMTSSENMQNKKLIYILKFCVRTRSRRRKSDGRKESRASPKRVTWSRQRVSTNEFEPRKCTDVTRKLKPRGEDDEKQTCMPEISKKINELISRWSATWRMGALKENVNKMVLQRPVLYRHSKIRREIFQTKAAWRIDTSGHKGSLFLVNWVEGEVERNAHLITKTQPRQI